MLHIQVLNGCVRFPGRTPLFQNEKFLLSEWSIVKSGFAHFSTNCESFINSFQFVILGLFNQRLLSRDLVGTVLKDARESWDKSDIANCLYPDFRMMLRRTKNHAEATLSFLRYFSKVDYKDQLFFAENFPRTFSNASSSARRSTGCSTFC